MINYHPYTIGFDSIFDRLETLSKRPQPYPPHDIIKIDDDTFAIQLAVAGLRDEDIDISYNKHILRAHACVRRARASRGGWGSDKYSFKTNTYMEYKSLFFYGDSGRS